MTVALESRERAVRSPAGVRRVKPYSAVQRDGVEARRVITRTNAPTWRLCDDGNEPIHPGATARGRGPARRGDCIFHALARAAGAGSIVELQQPGLWEHHRLHFLPLGRRNVSRAHDGDLPGEQAQGGDVDIHGHRNQRSWCRYSRPDKRHLAITGAPLAGGPEASCRSRHGCSCCRGIRGNTRDRLRLASVQRRLGARRQRHGGPRSARQRQSAPTAVISPIPAARRAQSYHRPS